MNILWKVGGLVALATTICKVLLGLGIILPASEFIAANSSFFYGLAGGIIIASFTKNLWFIMITIAGIFIRYVTSSPSRPKNAFLAVDSNSMSYFEI